MPAIVLLVPRGESSEIISVLTDYSAVELVDPFVWVDPADIGRFKTPTLRNISRTAPYMHNGLFELEGVLNMYNAGMPTPRRRTDQKDDPLFPVKSPHLQSLGLNRQDLDDLKAFLESLAETRWRLRPPELPESASTPPRS